ncbi:DNA internalization-related competence protein ComEC/Rec2 [Anaerovibrio sp. RM50]|uniref:DNA internalization-related competence protein ComEC/Rec2 n=1 Tax=Anaerovibrio sp. RM50 TaxID=1200557 RepID=UPI001E5C8D53|nr:DNA internalization-related competence protein ComEC/Rec2 [Anaerovibrio sp. RM50]
MFNNGLSPKLLVNLLLVLLVAGIILGREFNCLPGMKMARNDIGQWREQEITVLGELENAPVIRIDDEGKSHIKYLVNCERVLSSGNNLDTQGKIILYANDDSFDDHRGKLHEREYEEEKYGRSGDKIKVSGKLMKLHDYQNPGRMDTVMANYAQGIHGQMRAGKYSIELTSQDKNMVSRIAERIRHIYRSQMDSVMPKGDSAAIFAMLFGGYGGIRPELLEAFTVTGLIHILSVSGSHITLMAGTANVIGRLLGLSGGLTSVLATLIIAVYSLLAGFTTPVIRSAIMGVLTVLALSLGREKDAQHILSLTALGILLLWPLSLFDISFQLSFGATAGLLYLSPKIGSFLRKYMHRYVADSLGVTMGAQLAVLPFMAWYFNVISISSLLANLVVAPIVELIIVISLLAGVIVGVLPILGQFIFIISSMLLGLAYELTRLIARLPGSQIYIPTFSLPMWGIYYLLLLSVIMPEKTRLYYKDQILSLWLKTKNSNKGRYIIWGGAALMMAAIVMLYAIKPNEMQVHFIDVGQGDAALVITPHGHAFMVDTGGTRQGGYDIGARVDIPYLLHYGVRKLDFIMLTHAHDDHAKGVGGILGKIPVGAVMIGHEGREAYLKTFGGANPAVKTEPLVTLKEGKEMTLDGVRIQILYAPEENKTGGSTGNEFSNLIRVSYGNHSFLFTGDLSLEHESILCSRGTALESTVLKVGHHGSSTSSSENFLKAVKPQWSIISVGYGNSFGHPKKEILDRLEQCTASKILRTDENGAVVFYTDGEKLRVNTQIVYDK